MRARQRHRQVMATQSGFTLLEILIAMSIGIFMLGAIVTIEQGNKAVFGNQNNLAQLQDGERMALTMIADVIQSSGYYPNPVMNTVNVELPAVGAFAAGQAITGTYGGGAGTGDTITVRYVTTSTDGILNCSGTANTGADALYTNTFSVANGRLVCNMRVANGASTQYTLVGDGQKIVVNSLTVLYGVNTSGTGSNVDTYLNASQVANWNNIISVMITLNFSNPIYAAGQTVAKSTLNIQRVVDVMSQSGITL